jgi:hypothetical protein
MIVSTAWVQAMNEDKTKQLEFFFLGGNRAYILDFMRFNRSKDLLQKGKLILPRILDFV